MLERMATLLVASFAFLVLTAGCNDGLSEDEASAMIHQGLESQMKAGQLDWKRFPSIKTNPATNRASLSNFPDELKRWLLDAGFLSKGRGVPYEVVTATGLQYFESTPSIVGATEEVGPPSNSRKERTYTFYTHAIDHVEIVGVRNLGNDTYEVTYSPGFRRVNDDYMKHVPQWKEPVMERAMVFVRVDGDWKIQD